MADSSSETSSASPEEALQGAHAVDARRLLDAVDGSNEQPLAHGYRLKQNMRQGNLVIAAPDGRICLDIQVTPEGLKVSLDSAALAVQTSGAVNLACGSFEVDAERDIRLRAGGSLVSEAQEQQHRANLGDFTMEANDDVVLDGERVRLNSPDAGRAAPAALSPSLAGQAAGNASVQQSLDVGRVPNSESS